MKWSHSIGRFAGIELRVHFTFYILLAFLAITFHTVGGPTAAINAVAFILALFGCVLLHELGHALAARRFGIQTPDITLLPIGGLARLQRMPERPGQELIVAIAGPLVNVAIAGILFALPAVDFRMPSAEEMGDPETGFLTRLAWVNVILVVFNMLPAFPMDGGRMLRALLAMAMPYARATRAAANVGQAFAILFGLLGLLAFNPILILIAFFVYFGAQQEAQAAQIRMIGKETPVAEAMADKLETLGEKATLEDAVETMVRTMQHEFPVLDGDGHLLGVLTRDEMVSALRSHKRGETVTGFLKSDLPSVRRNDSFADAFQKMQESQSKVVTVVDEDGSFAGIITLETVGELLMLDSLRPGTDRPLWR